MAMGGVCYAEIVEIFVKNNNKEAFNDAMNGKLKLSTVTRDKSFNHFLQYFLLKVLKVFLFWLMNTGICW